MISISFDVILKAESIGEFINTVNVTSNVEDLNIDDKAFRKEYGVSDEDYRKYKRMMK